MNRAMFLRKKRAMEAAAAKRSANSVKVETSEKNTAYLTEEYKQTILSVSYLGTKGFTIPKDSLSREDLADLKHELTLRKTVQSPVPTEDIIVPVYRENDKKIYIPRFYAQKRYGKIQSSKIGEGESMQHTTFRGKMRDYQEEIVRVYTNSAREVGGGLISLHTGGGKTVISIKIATVIHKKTLIIVHKEFLMNQWIERIRDFCGEDTPIGRIQGDVFDVEGKDFVIGMLQTLYSRPYPENAFSQFGLLIIDETHRICSEQFSRALFKLQINHCLGISATIARKDGMETILNMFVGDVVYHKERDGNDLVTVRAVEYISRDEKFNEVEYDRRGTVKYSTMLSKLCDCDQRTEFVIKLIKDLIEETPEQQIMILAHNKSVLHYVHDAIRDRNIATVGYYIGGMKQKHLQETEEKQVVIATYAMASEALDIKTLATLVMVTPKTDIVQSVGRILRMKHENPIIVDVVDSHSVFQNQWKQRRVYYKKCNYRIRYIKSTEYRGMNIDWDEDTTWRRVFEPRNVAGATAPNHGHHHHNPEDEEDEIAMRNGNVPAEFQQCMIDVSKFKGGDDA